MKNTIISMALAAISFVACNDPKNKTDNNVVSTDSTKTTDQTPSQPTAGMVSIKEIVDHYLELKNALAKDNGKEASIHGKAIVVALNKIDVNSMTSDQKKTFNEVADDIKENADHISSNPYKIDHQREHFDMLSSDMYDLVKTFGAGQTLYKDFCPMFNDHKGAIWISETKNIQNPYYGKEMPTCGEMKEEIKQ